MRQVHAAGLKLCYGRRMAKFEPRDPFRTPGGFMPVSDAESGGLSDPLFERHHAALPRLDELPERRLHTQAANWISMVASVVALLLILSLLFYPDVMGSIFVR